MDSKETQCVAFLHTIGEQFLEVYDAFTFAEGNENKIEPNIAKFETYSSPKNVRTLPCTKIGQSLDASITNLRTKAKTCEIGALHDSRIRHRIVCGIDNKNVREWFPRNNEFTAEVAIYIVRAAGTSNSNRGAIRPSRRNVSYKRQETKPAKKSASEKTE